MKASSLLAASVLSYIAAVALFILLVLLPALNTWNTVWGAGGIVFAILLMPIAILAHPIVALVAGITTGIDAFLCYAALGLAFSLFMLGGWLSIKSCLFVIGEWLSEEAETKTWEYE